MTGVITEARGRLPKLRMVEYILYERGQEEEEAGVVKEEIPDRTRSLRRLGGAKKQAEEWL